MRMPSRPMMPGPITVARRMPRSVTAAINGCAWNDPAAVGARLRPISATTAPVTTGGMHRVDHAGADQLHRQADEHQHDAGGEDAAELRGGPVTGGRGQRRDERERRTEVTRDPAPRDDEEQRGADAGEQQRRRDREAGDRRHQQGGAEHRDHMLHPDADGARPRQPLVRCDHRAVADPSAVAVQRPSEHPGAGFPFGRALRVVLCTRHSWPIVELPPAPIHHRTWTRHPNHIRTECPVRAKRGYSGSGLFPTVDRQVDRRKGWPPPTGRWVAANPPPRQGQRIRPQGCRGGRRAALRREWGSGDLESGFYYLPTVLDGVRQGMSVVVDEGFGPVVTVETFTDRGRSGADRQRHASTAWPVRCGRRTPAGRSGSRTGCGRHRLDQRLPPLPPAGGVGWLRPVRLRPRTRPDGPRRVPEAKHIYQNIAPR